MNSFTTLSIIFALTSSIYGQIIHPEFRDIVAKNVNNVQATEFVYLGSAETSELAVFCDSVDMFSKISHILNKQITITFLAANVEGNVYIAQRAAKWSSFNVQMINEVNRKQVLDYLMDSSRVAIMPTLSESAPNSVFDCLYAGLPFLASNVPSISTFLSESSRTAHTFEVKPHHIASKMMSAARNGISSASPAFTISQAESVWTSLFAKVQPVSAVTEDARSIVYSNILPVASF